MSAAFCCSLAFVNFGIVLVIKFDEVVNYISNCINFKLQIYLCSADRMSEAIDTSPQDVYHNDNTSAERRALQFVR